MQTTATVISITEEEYIEFELKSNTSYEDVNDRFIDMPGESGLDSLLAANLLFIFKMILHHTNYKIFTHDARLKIPDTEKYYYPDLFVSTEVVNANKYIYYSAILVAEVLSGSTRSLDQFDKFFQYRKIPELKYYMLIAPVKKVVVLFSKNDQNKWHREFYNRTAKIINLPALQVSFKLADLYE
jgi:Uma2 family endonuclease